MRYFGRFGKWTSLGFCGWLAGCATVPAAVPQSLLQARQALQTARGAQAETLASADFVVAQRKLQEAESAWAGEKPMDTVEELTFEARAFAEIARADALRLQAEQAYSELAASLKREQPPDTQPATDAAPPQAPARSATPKPAPTPAAVAAAAPDRRQDEALLGQVRKVRDAEAALTPHGVVVILPSRDIFTANSSQLQETARQVLDQMAVILIQHPAYHAVIEGYTDNTGDALTNNTLSQAQAESVLNYLQQKGVTFDNLKAVGRGGSRPIAPNDQAWGRQRNFRLEFMLEKRTEHTTQP